MVEADAEKIQTAESSEIFKLQKVVTAHRGEKATKADNINMKNRTSGKIESAQTAKAKVKNLESKLQAQAAERTAKKLAAEGQELTAAERKILDQKAANTNMEVELQQAA